MSSNSTTRVRGTTGVSRGHVAAVLRSHTFEAGQDEHDQLHHTYDAINPVIGGGDHDKQPHGHGNNDTVIGGGDHDMQPHGNGNGNGSIIIGGGDHDKKPHGHRNSGIGTSINPVIGGGDHDKKAHVIIGGDDHDKQQHGHGHGHGHANSGTGITPVIGGGDHDKKPHGHGNSGIGINPIIGGGDHDKLSHDGYENGNGNVIIGGDDHDKQQHGTGTGTGSIIIGGGDHVKQPHGNGNLYGGVHAHARTGITPGVGGGDDDKQPHGNGHANSGTGTGINPIIIGGGDHDMQPHGNGNGNGSINIGGGDHDKKQHGTGTGTGTGSIIIGGGDHDKQPHGKNGQSVYVDNQFNSDDANKHLLHEQKKPPNNVSVLAVSDSTPTKDTNPKLIRDFDLFRVIKTENPTPPNSDPNVQPAITYTCTVLIAYPNSLMLCIDDPNPLSHDNDPDLIPFMVPDDNTVTNINVYAHHLYIKKGSIFNWPSKNVSIWCKGLHILPVNGPYPSFIQDAGWGDTGLVVLSVDGLPGAPPDPKPAPDPPTTNRPDHGPTWAVTGYQGGPGKDGADGHPGQDAGSLTLWVTDLMDQDTWNQLRFSAVGGKAGNGQDGGDGQLGGPGSAPFSYTTMGGSSVPVAVENPVGAGPQGPQGPGGKGGFAGLSGAGGSITIHMALADATANASIKTPAVAAASIQMMDPSSAEARWKPGMPPPPMDPIKWKEIMKGMGFDDDGGPPPPPKQEPIPTGTFRDGGEITMGGYPADEGKPGLGSGPPSFKPGDHIMAGGKRGPPPTYDNVTYKEFAVACPPQHLLMILSYFQFQYLSTCTVQTPTTSSSATIPNDTTSWSWLCTLIKSCPIGAPDLSPQSDWKAPASTGSSSPSSNNPLHSTATPVWRAVYAEWAGMYDRLNRRLDYYGQRFNMVPDMNPVLSEIDKSLKAFQETEAIFQNWTDKVQQQEHDINSAKNTHGQLRQTMHNLQDDINNYLPKLSNIATQITPLMQQTYMAKEELLAASRHFKDSILGGNCNFASVISAVGSTLQFYHSESSGEAGEAPGMGMSAFGAGSALLIGSAAHEAMKGLPENQFPLEFVETIKNMTRDSVADSLSRAGPLINDDSKVQLRVAKKQFQELYDKMSSDIDTNPDMSGLKSELENFKVKFDEYIEITQQRNAMIDQYNTLYVQYQQAIIELKQDQVSDDLVTSFAKSDINDLISINLVSTFLGGQFRRQRDYLIYRLYCCSRAIWALNLVQPTVFQDLLPLQSFSNLNSTVFATIKNNLDKYLITFRQGEFRNQWSTNPVPVTLNENNAPNTLKEFRNHGKFQYTILPVHKDDYHNAINNPHLDRAKLPPAMAAFSEKAAPRVDRIIVELEGATRVDKLSTYDISIVTRHNGRFVVVDSQSKDYEFYCDPSVSQCNWNDPNKKDDKNNDKQNDSAKSLMFDDQSYPLLSPYGKWSIEVNTDLLNVKEVTAITINFIVKYKSFD